MKTIYTLIISIMSLSALIAQTPQKMNYQAVLRNSSGEVQANEEINLELAIIEDAIDGIVIFNETHTITTNEFGLINLEFGSVNQEDFKAIDWSSGVFFLRVSVNGSELGTTQLLSVPYALYANKAQSAETIDYEKIYNKPDFSGWDHDVSDDFDGNYDSLTGAPENFWMQNDTNLFYYAGGVGINIDESTGFGGAVLHVGGGIRYEGLPNDTTPGVLYYDPSGDGTFKYFDNTGVAVNLGTGNLSYSGSYEANVSGDIVKPNDYIISGSMEIGFDAVNGYNFGYNTLVFAENNLRILFEDTDTMPGAPNNDWQIEINESANGGTNHFAINDITSGTTPFKIMAGAPDNSLYISPEGNVGIGTKETTNKLTVNGSLRAASFIGDGSALSGITGGTGGVGNAESTVIGADTDSNGTGEIALQTKDTTRMIITNNGKIGIGITMPSADIEIAGTAKFENLQVGGILRVDGIAKSITTENPDGSVALDYNVTGKSVVNIQASAVTTFIGFTGGIAGQEITLINIGGQNLVMEHNAGGTQPFLLASNLNITIAGYNSATFLCDGTNWYCIGKSN